MTGPAGRLLSALTLLLLAAGVHLTAGAWGWHGPL